MNSKIVSLKQLPPANLEAFNATYLKNPDSLSPSDRRKNKNIIKITSPLSMAVRNKTSGVNTPDTNATAG